MRIVQAFATISCGAIAGWLAVASFMVLHDRASIGEVLWLVTLWLPVAAVYSAIIVAVSYRLLARFASTLLLLLGCVVGLLPFFGFWPPYLVMPAFLPLFFGIHLAALAIAGFAWAFIVLLATPMGLTNR